MPWHLLSLPQFLCLCTPYAGYVRRCVSMMLLPTLTPLLSRTTRNTWTTVEGGRHSSQTLTSVTRMQATKTVSSGHVWRRCLDQLGGGRHLCTNTGLHCSFYSAPACCPTKRVHCVKLCKTHNCIMQLHNRKHGNGF